MGRREHGWRRPARRVATRAGDERGALASDGWRERVHGARAQRDGGAPANNGRPACSGRGWTVFQVPTGWTVFQTPSTPWASFNRPMGDVWARSAAYLSYIREPWRPGWMDLDSSSGRHATAAHGAGNAVVTAAVTGVRRAWSRAGLRAPGRRASCSGAPATAASHHCEQEAFFAAAGQRWMHGRRNTKVGT